MIMMQHARYVDFDKSLHSQRPSFSSQVEKASTSNAGSGGQLPELGENGTALLRELQEATPLLPGRCAVRAETLGTNRVTNRVTNMGWRTMDGLFMFILNYYGSKCDRMWLPHWRSIQTPTFTPHHPHSSTNLDHFGNLTWETIDLDFSQGNCRKHLLSSNGTARAHESIMSRA